MVETSDSLLNKCLLHFLNRIITVADIQKQTPLITTGEPTLGEAKMKYIKQTEHALYELSEKITDFPKEKNRKFCSLIFQVSMHFCWSQCCPP